MTHNTATSSDGLRPVVAKVPQITALFWVIKLLTTGMGEACSDWLGSISVVLAAVVGVFGLVGVLFLQLRTPVYRPQLYWATVSMVAVFGTMAADGLHIAVGLPYPATTTLYVLAVAAIFTGWYRSEHTLSIHSITTPKREKFYWATVLATFALGTAAGDMSASTMHLGYFPSAVLFGVLILVPLIGWRLLKLNSVVAFWVAYVLTRPLGASLADWLSKPQGLDIGDGTVTLVLVMVIVAIVAYVTATNSEPADDLAVTPAGAIADRGAPE
ncbi:hypothetical protein [Rudaeicoccus suwonensis]|uniref:Putative membrane-anchored protein n=1 Tax=Rudaeicoccus suwonensis TaxID=657409 RepID=A0A561E807_9MICO|nr:hypothetical protein [Rudaeicoccus suwonensis]TWE11700.1 putative membrane-anchored protein [Rudaeicoccus suwonensis]